MSEKKKTLNGPGLRQGRCVLINRRRRDVPGTRARGTCAARAERRRACCDRRHLHALRCPAGQRAARRRHSSLTLASCFSLLTGATLRPPALDPVSCWSVEPRGGSVYVGEKLARAEQQRIPLEEDMPHAVVILGPGAAGNEAAGRCVAKALPAASPAAGKLQKAGLIRYARGRISVLDRKGLEKRTF